MAARIKKPLIRQAGSAEAFMGSAATGREQAHWQGSSARLSLYYEYRLRQFRSQGDAISGRPLAKFLVILNRLLSGVAMEPVRRLAISP